MLPQIPGITIEENRERVKIVLPVRRNQPLYLLFTVSLLIWVVMVVVVILFLLRDVLPNRERYTLVLTVMMLVWLVIWYYLGRLIWGRWQYYAANREILFVNPERLIVRRPVSILGLTDAYDMAYVNPFYFSEEHQCLAFDYGAQRIYFGHQLPVADARRLLRFLNGRFYPDVENDFD